MRLIRFNQLFKLKEQENQDQYRPIIDDVEAGCNLIAKCLRHLRPDTKLPDGYSDDDIKQSMLANVSDFPSFPCLGRQKQDGDSWKKKDGNSFKSDIPVLINYVFDQLDKPFSKPGLSNQEQIDELKVYFEGCIEKDLIDHIDRTDKEVSKKVSEVLNTVGYYLDMVSVGLRESKLSTKQQKRSNSFDVDFSENVAQLDCILKYSGEENGLAHFKMDKYSKTKLAPDGDQDVAKVARLLSLVNFALDGVFMAVVVCQPENYLDVFESLNTAGRPLTAIETFIPEVHKFFNDYKGSYLEKKIWETTKLEKSQKEYGALETGCYSPDDLLSSLQSLLDINSIEKVEPVVISFALINSGEKCGGNAGDQRKYLEDSFRIAYKRSLELMESTGNGVASLKPVYNYLFTLYQTVKWWSLMLSKKDVADKFDTFFQRGDDKFTKQAKFCLQILRESNLVVAQSIACRFYIQYVTADEKRREEAYSIYINVIRALAVFSALWLSSFESTAGIEGYFRQMISGNSSKNLRSISIEALDQQSEDLISAEEMISRMHSAILEKFGTSHFDRNIWLRYLKTSKTGKRMAVSKFLLLAYLEGSEKEGKDKNNEDKNKFGLRKIKDRKSDKDSSYFTLETWLKYAGSNFEVEHVLPQNPKSGGAWDKMLTEGLSARLEDRETQIHMLGNLLLLPKNANKILSNREWDQKRKALICMSVNDKVKVESLKKEFQLDESDSKINKVLENMLKSEAKSSVEEFDSEDLQWNLDFIAKRTERMTEVIWQNLNDFLDLDALAQKEKKLSSQIQSTSNIDNSEPINQDRKSISEATQEPNKNISEGLEGGGSGSEVEVGIYEKGEKYSQPSSESIPEKELPVAFENYFKFMKAKIKERLEPDFEDEKCARWKSWKPRSQIRLEITKKGVVLTVPQKSGTRVRQCPPAKKNKAKGLVSWIVDENFISGNVEAVLNFIQRNYQKN